MDEKGGQFSLPAVGMYKKNIELLLWTCELEHFIGSKGDQEKNKAYWLAS